MKTSDLFHNRENIRVLLAHLPETTVQLLKREFEKQQDLYLVGSVHDDVQLLAYVTQDIDVLVLGIHDATLPPGLISHLFNELPRLRIATLQIHNDHVVEYWLGLRQKRAYPQKISELAAIIRRLHEYDIME